MQKKLFSPNAGSYSVTRQCKTLDIRMLWEQKSSHAVKVFFC